MSEAAIFNLYKSLCLGKNQVCQNCKATANTQLDGPVAIWQVGTQYEADEYRLVFVGKNARGSIHERADEQLAHDGFINGTPEADKWIQEKWGAYWYYTAAVIERLFGSLDTGWERIAFTNLVKCNNSMSIDTTTSAMRVNCLDKLGVTWKELEILRPRNIILFSGDEYDPFIERYTNQFQCRDRTNREHKVTNGEKTILWWERHCVSKDGRNFRVLRTSHPERQKKEAFVNRLEEWIKSTC